jgi:hypothetical protein
MRFRFGFFLGLAVGYVLGTKAGRARYEQILQWWGQVKSSEQAQQLGADVRVAASKAGQRVGEAADAGVAKVTGLVRGQHNGDATAPTDLHA